MKNNKLTAKESARRSRRSLNTKRALRALGEISR